jgi:hypothetical protein
MSNIIHNDGFALLQQSQQEQPGLITEAQVQGLPAPVQRYLTYAKVVGKEPVRTVRLSQRGFMLGTLGVGDLQTAEGPAIALVAAGCYLMGGLMILLHRRWLWIVGAVINALVIMFSAGGLTTKAAQLLLEVCLLYLIITDRRSLHHHAGW